MTVLDRIDGDRLDTLQRITAAMRERAQHRGDELRVRPGVTWISFRSTRASRVFAEVRPGRNGLQAFLLPPRSELRDAGGFARPAPESQGWGWFRTKAVIPANESRAAISLLTQSLDFAYRLPPSRRRLGSRGG